MLNKDFYKDLPEIVCEMMEYICEKYGKEEWFEKAWEEYRNHVLTSDIDDMLMPGAIFNKYIKK